MLKFSKFAWKLFFTITILSVAALTALLIHLEANLPSVDMLRDVHLQVPLKVYAADGKLIAEYGEKRRTPLTLAQIPKQLKDAVIATEDRRFYKHPGVDIRGLARAVVNLVQKGTKEQGGSTITMQVARNFFLTRQKTYTRKLNEILLALKIEQELSKDEILELYLNKIYFGKRAYGVAAAAEVYYGTTVDKLTLAQMAMLAGLPQAPSAINPLNSPESAIKRRTHVLDRMLAYNLITHEEYDNAMQQPIATIYHGRPIELNAPFVAEMARQKVIEMFGEDAYAKGYQVYTSVDSKLQAVANNSLNRGVLEYDQRHGYRGPLKRLRSNSNYNAALQDVPRVSNLIPAVIVDVADNHATALLKDGFRVTLDWDGLVWANANANTANQIVQIGDLVYVAPYANNQHWRLAQLPQIEAAMVALNPNTGAILALIGGFDYERSSFNRAVQASRQPGSSFKPFIYAAALENNFTPASIMNDAPIVQEDASNEDWRPRNSTREFYGPTRLRTALTYSRNLVSIRLLQAVGINNTIEVLSKMGFDSSTLPRGLSLALGTNHLSPLQSAAAYSIFANGGYKVEPFLITKILDSQGNVIYVAPPPTNLADPNVQPVIKPQTAYQISSMLQDVIKKGSGKYATQIGRNDLSGKTGTTNEHFDGWFCGYNRDLVATFWVGYDEPRSLKEFANHTALPLWTYFMDQALRGKPENPPIQPPGLVTVKIDPLTGLLARSGQADAIYEIFTEETAPKIVATSNLNHEGATSEQNANNQLLEADNLF